MVVEPRLRLRTKLGLALGALAALVAAALWSLLGPQASASFVRRSDEIVESSTELMRELARRHTAESREVLIDLIEHTTDVRSRTLQDLPLSLYGGDVDRIRAAVREQDLERSARLQQNVHLLAAEMERRATARIDRHLDRLAERQRAAARAFADDVRVSSVWAVGLAMLLVLLVLGFGLNRLVIAPVARLRAATRRVSSGDYGVVLPPPSRHAARDEVALLAHDFARMLEQLRASHSELERLNQGLESEVARKTQHLEQAFADLQRTHRQLLQAEKMASIGTLAGGVAHEFNNLIGGIRGCIAEHLHAETDPERHETLAVALRAADRAGDITRQLLRLSRAPVDSPRPVDVSTLLGDALRLVEPQARRLGVQVERAIAADLRTRADEDGLHQVFLNLLTNALQAMPDGGTLRVTAVRAPAGRVPGNGLDADAASMDDGRAPDDILVEVADTGRGIAAADLPRVFEPFFTRKDRERDPFLRGSGLGLSVSYGIVAAHGGSLSVASEPGQGATFTVRLPARADGAASAGHGTTTPTPEESAR